MGRGGRGDGYGGWGWGGWGGAEGAQWQHPGGQVGWMFMLTPGVLRRHFSSIFVYYKCSKSKTVI